MKSLLSKLPAVLFVFLILFGYGAAAQDSTVEMADVMRSNGKIYVVVAVAAVVLTGILVYLIIIDRKVAAIEKRLKTKI